MNLQYLIPRVIRHFLPASMTRFLLKRGWIIRPGLETRAPFDAAKRYADTLSEKGIELAGKRVLVFGYGGNFAIACALLKLGAQHVTLCEKDAPPDQRGNAALLPEYSKYLRAEEDQVFVRPEYISLAQGDIRQLAAQKAIEPCDLVVSTSVYEHLDDVEGITRALARLTCSGGAHLHYVDLRDHYFKYPFEMLCYSRQTWYGWLNPTSNHNRFRYNDYRRVFEKNFEQVEITVLARDLVAFEKARPRILPEFLSGDPQVDAITSIQVFARQPIQG